MIRRMLLLALAVAPLISCSLEPEKQWYKPNANYTVADFKRDEVACTRNSALDEQCMKGRGWVPLSGDPERVKSPEETRTPGTKGVHY